MTALRRPRVSLALPVLAVVAGLTYALTSGVVRSLVLAVCVAAFWLMAAIDISSTRGSDRIREVLTVVAIVAATTVAIMIGSWDPIGVVMVAIVASDAFSR